MPPQDPAPRYLTVLSSNMSDFLHSCPSIATLLIQVNAACDNKDASALKNALIRPDEAAGDHVKFLALLQQELKRTSPANDEALLTQSIENLTLGGWLSAKPVVFDYLRLIRDWVWPTTEHKLIQLKRMIEDVSRRQTEIPYFDDFLVLTDI